MQHLQIAEFQISIGGPFTAVGAFLDGRPLQLTELWNELIPRNTGREYELSFRNKLLLLMCCYTSLRPIEISVLQIKDLVSPDGKLIELMILPASKAFDGKYRPILFSHKELRTVIEDYLAWLIELDCWSHPGKQYLGRDPNAPLMFFEISNNEPRGFGV